MINSVKETNENPKLNKSEEQQNELFISLRKFQCSQFLTELQEFLKIQQENIEIVSITEYPISEQQIDQVITHLLTLPNVKRLYLGLLGTSSDYKQVMKLMNYPLLEQVKITKYNYSKYEMISEIGTYLKGLKYLKHLSIQLVSTGYQLDVYLKEFINGLSSCANLEAFKLTYVSTSYDIDITSELINCLATLQKLKSIKFPIRQYAPASCDHVLSSLIQLPQLEKLKIYLYLKPAQSDSSQDKQVIQENVDSLYRKQYQLKNVSKNLKEIMLKLYSQYTVDSQIPYIGNIENLQILTLHICYWNVDICLAREFYSSISKLNQLIEVNLLFQQLYLKGNHECSYLLGFSFAKLMKLKRMQLFHQFQPANLEELRVFLINFGLGISQIKNLITLRLAIGSSELSHYEKFLYNFRKIRRLSTIIHR